MATTFELEHFDLSYVVPKAVKLDIKRGRPTSSIVLPRGFPEAKLFALLKAFLGAPNGIMSLAIGAAGDPDAPFKYEYLFQLPDGTSLSVLRSWLNVEVQSFGRKIQVNEIVSMFTYNFNLHEEKVSDSLSNLEVYRLVINPHARHRRMMESFEKELKAIKVHEPNYPSKLICTKQEKRSWQKQVKAYLSNMHSQNTLAVCVVMESAYTAESLLNLFIAVLKKPILSSNPKMLKDALFEGWKDKIERLPLHCDHLASSPNPDHPAVKAVDRVFKRRNRIAHSYPDPDDLCAEKIWFDDRVPILPNCGPYLSYQLGADALLPSPPDALECPGIVNNFTEYMFGLLPTPARDEMELFCRSNPIGFSEKTGRYGVPFAEDIFMALFTMD